MTNFIYELIPKNFLRFYDITGNLGVIVFDVNDKVKGNDILNIQNALQIFVNTGPSCMTYDEFNTI